MKSRNPLHELIHALSPNEKRYIRLFAKRHSVEKSPRYIHLFDYLDKHEKIDEHNLLEKIYAGKDRSLFASEKQYLFETILDGMRMYHSERTVDQSISEALSDAGFLFSKRLYDESQTALQNAHLLAEKSERWSSLIEIVKMECDIIKEKKRNRMQSELQLKSEELRAYLLLQKEDAELKLRRDYLFALVRTANPQHDCREELAHWKMQEQQENFSAARFNQRYYTLSSLGLLQYFLGAYDEAFCVYEQLMMLWGTHPFRIKADRLLYSKGAANALNAALSARKFDVLETWLAEYEKLDVYTREEVAEKFQNLTFIRLRLMLCRAEFSEFEPLVLEIQKGLKKYRTKINKARELAYYYNIAVVCFIREDWRNALRWINLIIEHEKVDHRQDIQYFARIFRWLFYYELDKHDLLEYDMINTERYLRQRKAWFQYEATITKMIRKLLDTGPDERSAIFRQLGSRLEKLMIEQKNTSRLGSHEIQLWIHHHAEEKSLLDLLREETAQLDA